MIFNINENVSKSNSGIESAQFNRFKVFRKKKIPFALVTIAYSPESSRLLLHEGVYDFPLKKEEYINLYDYFQRSHEATFKKNTLDNIDYGIKGQRLSMQYNSTFKKIELKDENDKLLVRIDFYQQHHFDNLEDYRKLQVHGVEIFDNFGNLVQYKVYDYNGWLSSEQIFNPDNSVSNFVYYDINQHIVMEEFFQKKNSDDKLHVTLYTLYDKEGKAHLFNNHVDLLTYFYNSLNDNWDNEPINIFVADRSSACQESLLELKHKAYLVFHFHNSQGGRVEDEMYSIVNNNYEYALNHLNDFNASIVATHKQLVDMKERYGEHKIFQIPVGTVSDKTLKQKNLPMNKRTKHSLIVTARVASEKQIEDMVFAVKDVKKKYPDVVLDVYGYKDASDNYLEKRRIEYLVDRYNLQDNVFLHDYAQDVASLQRQHQIYLLASSMEGFNIALMEGLAQGCIGVVYNVNYGPNELVQDNENGYVVPLNRWDIMRDKIEYLFAHPDKMQEMSDKAHELSKRYSNEVVYKQWKKIMEDAYSNL